MYLKKRGRNRALVEISCKKVEEEGELCLVRLTAIRDRYRFSYHSFNLPLSRVWPHCRLSNHCYVIVILPFNCSAAVAMGLHIILCGPVQIISVAVSPLSCSHL